MNTSSKYALNPLPSLGDWRQRKRRAGGIPRGLLSVSPRQVPLGPLRGTDPGKARGGGGRGRALTPQGHTSGSGNPHTSCLILAREGWGTTQVLGRKLYASAKEARCSIKRKRKISEASKEIRARLSESAWHRWFWDALLCSEWTE